MRKLGLLLGLAAVACTAYGASPQFTYADIAAGKFAQRTVAGLRSMADGEHYTVLDSGRVVVFSYASGDQRSASSKPHSSSYTQSGIPLIMWLGTPSVVTAVSRPVASSFT